MPSAAPAVSDPVVLDLLAVLPADRVLLDPDAMARYLHDEAEWAEHGRAAAVVRPQTTAEVAAVVGVCARHRRPLVPRGAGTGLSGGANAVDGCVLLSTERMNEIVEINSAERLAVVQPGVVNDELRRGAAKEGLWYPPDPASAPWSTIGGNVATNAGGLCCVKYGVTRDYVLALEVVTASGEVVRVGRRTAKGVAGYDLAGLLVGSEGTLAVITEITVRLRPQRSTEPRTVVGFFDTLAAAGDAVAGVIARGLNPSAFELIDRECLRAVNEWKQAGLPETAAALLLAQTDLPEPAAEQEAAAIHEEFVAAGASEAMASTDPVEAEALFDARRLAYPALEQRGMAMLTEDVCLPRGQGRRDAGPDRGDRGRARGPDRHRRARRRRQPAPADAHPARRRRGQAPRPGRVRRHHRRGHRAGRHGHRGARGRACSSATACGASSGRRCWPCSGRSSRRWTRTGS